MAEDIIGTTGEAISRVERAGGDTEAKFDVSEFEKARAADDAGKKKSGADAPATEGNKEEGAGSGVEESAPSSSAPLNPFEKSPKSADWKAMKTKHTGEMAALQKQLADLQGLQGQGDNERDPEFNRRYEAQESAAIEGAKQAAGSKGDELATLLKGPGGPWRDQKVNELLGEVDDMSKVRLMGALQTLSTIEFQKRSEVSASLANWDHNQKEQSVMGEQQQQANQRQYEEIFEKKLGEMQSDGKLGNWMFKQQEGNEVHNKSIAESVDEAKIIMRGQLTPERAVEIALNQGAYPRLVSAFNDVVSERDALHDKLSGIQGSQPGIGGGGDVKGDGGAGLKVGDSQYSQYMANGIAAAQAQDRANS